MANTVAEVYISTFENTLRHLAQQSETKLRAHVTERGTNGSDHSWERLGTSEASEKTGRIVATPVADTPWSRRLSVAKTYHNADSSENEDIVQMLIDPNSNLAMSLSMSMKRQWDRSIIAAATGLALDGDGTTTYDLAVVNSGNQVVGDYSGEITFDMITEIQERFMDNNIDPEEPKVMVVGPKQVRKLMQLTENTSSDYVEAQRLQRYGITPNWMGFTWIYSTLLNVPSTDQLDCFAMTKRALGLQMNRDMLVRVAEDPSVSFAWRIYCETTFGVVRIEDEHLVHLRVADTLA